MLITMIVLIYMDYFILLNYFLKKLLECEIQTSNYQKEEILSLVIKDLLKNNYWTLKKKRVLIKKNYFLLSYYLKGIDRLIKVKNFDGLNYQEKISNSILDNLKKSLSNITNDKRVYIDFPFFRKYRFPHYSFCHQKIKSNG